MQADEQSPIRASAQERESAVAALSTHMREQRIDSAEFDQRAAVAYQATSRQELGSLFADLPDPKPTLEGDTSVPAATDARGDTAHANASSMVPEGSCAGTPSRRPDGRLASLVYGLFSVAGVVAIVLVVLTGSWFWIIAVPALASTARMLVRKNR